MNTPYATPVRTSTAAVLSLVFGLLSWILLPLIGAVAAVICGHMGRSECKANPGMDGDGLAVAGLVLGYLHLATMLLAIIAAIIFFGGLAAFLAWIAMVAH